MSQWMALVRANGHKQADWDIVAQKVDRETAVLAAQAHIESLGIAYRMGYRFDDGEQQIAYADGYDGSPVLGKIVRQSKNPDVIHAVPWTL